MNAIIRPARTKDLPGLLQLYAQLGMDDGEVLSLKKAIIIFRRLKRYPDYRIYVACEKNLLIGTFALLIMDNLGHQGKPSAIIEDVVVHQDWRFKGIGRKMIAYALAVCSKKGCYKLSLSSNKKRLGAHHFYEKLGFQRHGVSFMVCLKQEGRSQ